MIITAKQGPPIYAAASQRSKMLANNTNNSQLMNVCDLTTVGQHETIPLQHLTTLNSLAFAMNIIVASLHANLVLALSMNILHATKITSIASDPSIKNHHP